MQALCRLFFKILDKRPAAGEQGRMYSTLEKVILLALSDRSFAAAEAPDRLDFAGAVYKSRRPVGES